MRIKAMGMVALAGAVLWAGTAQALSVDVTAARRARVVQVDADTIVFKSRRKGRATFTVSLSDSAGTSSISSGTSMDVDLLIVKRSGKKKRRTITLTGDEHEFTLRGPRRVVMDFVGTTVPEPGTAAMLGLGLAGLAAAGRRRQRV